jgi:hypothetical protein
VLPQGFRDSPYLLEQALTKDLLDWQHPGFTLLQSMLMTYSCMDPLSPLFPEQLNPF